MADHQTADLNAVARLRSLSADRLFREAGLTLSGSASWGETVKGLGSGVYVVSIEDLSRVGYSDRVELERSRWEPDQEIIYIGRSNNLSRRLGEFYKHEYGKCRPHRGGQAILLLECAKTVCWAATKDYVGAERRLIETFEKEVGRSPFGNRIRSARVSKNPSQGITFPVRSDAGS